MKRNVCQTNEEFTSLNKLYDLLYDCAKLRGCFPLVHRSQSEFIEWLLANKTDELIPFAEEFKQYCENKYTKKE